MLTDMLRSIRRSLRGKAIRKPLEALGIIALGKNIYQKQVLAKGEQSATLMGVPLRFAVSSNREIARIDATYLEEEFISRLIDCLKPGDVMYDVGANIGMVTLITAGLAAKAGKNITIHSFEPEPRNFQQIQRNVELNKLSNVRCHQVGLAADDSGGKLFVEGETGVGTHSIISQNNEGRDAISIELRNGSDFARKLGAIPTVMKIDVEGAEMEVLKGFRQLLEAKQIREILIEVHPLSLKHSGTSAEELTQLLLSCGYQRIWSQNRNEEFHEHYRA